MSVIADAKAGLHSIKTDPSKEDVLEKLAQAGYLTKGALYIVIGFLTVRAAIGFGGEIAGSKDAIKFIAGQPMGRILLILMAFGLFSYGAWRYAKAYLARVKNKRCFRGNRSGPTEQPTKKPRPTTNPILFHSNIL